MEKLQIFDNEILPYDINEIFTDDESIILYNGSYIKWFPNRPEYHKYGINIHNQINDILIKDGMIKENDKYFKVLIYFSW